MDNLVDCKHCGARTPSENFNCIYCGKVIFENSGFLGRLRYGRSHFYTVILALIIVLAFFLWYVIW